MPTKKQTVERVGAMPEEELTLKELTILLIKHLDHHEGLYDLAFQLRIATGAMGTEKDNILPGAMIGISGVGLKRVEKVGTNTLDAAEVNPKPRVRKKAAKPKV